MTIERPYQRGLRIEEAFDEVRYSGTQFSPRVVDAFFAAVAKRPAISASPIPKRSSPASGSRRKDENRAGRDVGPASPFRCSMRQIAFRGSPA